MADHIRKARYAASRAADGQDLPLSVASDFGQVPDHAQCDNHEDRFGRMAHYVLDGRDATFHGRLCDECLRELANDVEYVPSEAYKADLRDWKGGVVGPARTERGAENE